jgi:signal peptidase I
MTGGVLNINGTPIKHERADDFTYNDNGRTARARRWRETLPNGVTYQTLDVVANSYYDNTPVYTVPAGHYFMLGDNLDNSSDSRVLSQIGYIPFENLIGRVAFVLWSPDNERIGMSVR